MKTPRFTRLALAFVGIGLLSACGTTSTKRITAEGAEVRDQGTRAARFGLPASPLILDDATIGSAAYGDAQAAKARKPQVAKHATRAWIGARLTAVQSDEVLPPIFSERFVMNFDDRLTNGRVGIEVIAERLSRLTNVPVRVKGDVFASAASTPLDKMQAAIQGINASTASMASQGLGFNGSGAVVPPLMAPGSSAGVKLPPLPGAVASMGVSDRTRNPVTDITAIESKYDGTLISYLDQITGRLNLSWAYRDGVVVIERFVTESFELSAFMGTQNYSMNVSGTNSGQSGGSSGSGGGNSASATASLDVTEAGKISALDSLRKAVESMVVPSGGSVLLSEGTGRFTVTATKDVMGRVREVLKHEEAAMRRRAHIQIDVYSITTNDADERGIDWNVVFQNLSNTWGASIKSPASLAGATGGSLGYTIMAPSDGSSANQRRFGNSSAVLTLLNQITDTVQYRPVSMVAMNRQWARQQSLKSEGYLSETTPSTSSAAGSGAPGLKTSSVVTGDKFLVQPAIMDNGVIMLKFGISMTELLSLFDVSVGSGATLQKVQTPVTSGTDNQTTIMLNPGEAMLVTGMSRRVSAGDVRTLGPGVPVMAGGSRKLGYKREDFMIVVRAVQM